MRGWHLSAIVAGTKGLNGRLRLKSASAFLRFASVGDEVAFVPPVEDAPRFARVIGGEEAGAEGVLTYLEGISSAKDAEALIGCRVLLRSEEMQEWIDASDEVSFIGFQVIDESLGKVGTVQSVDDDRLQPIASIMREDGSVFAMPFIEDMILDVSMDDEVLHVDLPKGLLEL